VITLENYVDDENDLAMKNILFALKDKLTITILFSLYRSNKLKGNIKALSRLVWLPQNKTGKSKQV